MWNQASLDLIVNARMEPDDVLVLGDNSDTLAADIKAFVGDHTVVALPSTSLDHVMPGTHRDWVTSAYVVQGQPIRKKISLIGAFRYVVCTGPSTLLDASTLPPLLKLWRTYLKDTAGRIVLRMYAAPGEGGGDWRAMESRYRDAGVESQVNAGGCGLYETAGLYSEFVEFDIDGTDVQWLRSSIENIANRVEEVGKGDGGCQASRLRRRADQLMGYGRRCLTEDERDILVRRHSSKGVFYAAFRIK